MESPSFWILTQSATGSADELMMLVEGPQTMRPVGEAGIARHERPVFVLDLLPDFGRETRRADRARIPRIGRGLREHALARLGLAFPGLVAAFGDFRAPVGRYGLSDVLRQHRKRRLRVRADGDVDLLVALEILIVGADVKVAHADADQPGPGLRAVDLRHLDRVVGVVDRAPEVGQLEAENNVGSLDQPAAAQLIEGVIVRHVHAAELIDHGRIQRFSELHQMLDARRRAADAVDDDDGVFCQGQQARRFTHRIRIARGRRHVVEPRNNQRPAAAFDRIFLKLLIEHHEDRLERRRHRYLVGAHHRFGEVLQRLRIVVPFGEVANERARILHGVNGGNAGLTRGRVHAVADHDD